MNPDQIIANFWTKTAELKMEIIHRGRKRVFFPLRQIGIYTRGAGNNSIDAIFSPVKKVNYHVDPTMVPDQITDFDKLTSRSGLMEV